MAQKGAARPQVTVYSTQGHPLRKSLPIYDVLLAPLRADLVKEVHKDMNKNKRQAYSVQVHTGPKGIVAGHQVAARSWGTGRAVARIPRVKGGGTHRAGQGAYGNMCRGGRMFAPTKTWRRWHRKVNVNQKRFAVVSAISASAVPSLVMARGHRIQTVQEVPLVVSSEMEKIDKTRDAQKLLNDLRLGPELRKCKKRYKRAGKGKMRGRRWKHRTGPLIVYKQDDGLVRAFRNIRGVDTCKVTQLNLLLLAPGGHMGRLIVWTESAYRMLPQLYGSQRKGSSMKHNYQMPRPMMSNSDLNRIIMSQEVQSVLKPKQVQKRQQRKRNPLKNGALMAKLNPRFDRDVAQRMRGEKRPLSDILVRDIIPPRKKQRLTGQSGPEMAQYWDLVLGDGLFKTRQQIQDERDAVEAAKIAAEREKLGLDLMDDVDDDMQGGAGGGSDEESD